MLVQDGYEIDYFVKQTAYMGNKSKHSAWQNTQATHKYCTIFLNLFTIFRLNDLVLLPKVVLGNLMLTGFTGQNAGDRARSVGLVLPAPGSCNAKVELVIAITHVHLRYIWSCTTCSI